MPPASWMRNGFVIRSRRARRTENIHSATVPRIGSWPGSSIVWIRFMPTAGLTGFAPFCSSCSWRKSRVMGCNRVAAVWALLAVAGVCAAQQRSGWALPNFSDRVEIEVSNPGAAPLATLAVLDIAQVRKQAPGFPGSLAIVAQQVDRTRFLPSQVDGGSAGESERPEKWRQG